MLSPFADDYAVARLLRAVQQAPSVRESQPWSFRIVAADRVELRAERSRWLEVADPRARGLTISCGAALFNLRMALRVTGHNVAVWLLPDPDQDASLLASVEIVTGRTLGPSVAHQELYDAIPKRRTNRSLFTGPPVPPRIIVPMQRAAAAEEGYLRLLTRREAKQWMRTAMDAQQDLAAYQPYQEELKRLAPDHLMLSGAGDPLPSQQVDRRPQILVLSTDHDRPLDWLRAGQALQRSLLTGTRYGVVASFLAQPLELRDMTDGTEPVLTHRRPWKWPWSEVPQMVMRIGHLPQERDDVFRPQLPHVTDVRTLTAEKGFGANVRGSAGNHRTGRTPAAVPSPHLPLHRAQRPAALYVRNRQWPHGNEHQITDARLTIAALTCPVSRSRGARQFPLASRVSRSVNYFSEAREAEVAVVGAGQAGLSAAYFLARAGLRAERDFLVFDHSPAPGGAWQFRWPTLTYGKTHRVHDLPGLPLDGADEGRPASEVVGEYFAAYERAFRLRVRRPVEVSAVSAAGEGADGRLLVETNAGRWLVRALVNATGTWDRPFWPRYPGQGSFSGRQVHTAQYRGPGEFAGLRVLVVGGGASGTQHLMELAGVAARTTWVTRRPPVFVDGPFDAERGRHAVWLVEERVRQGLPPGSVVSVTGLPRTPAIEEARALGVLDRLPMFDRITPEGVAWDDGRRVATDVILWATGFRAALGHLAPLRLREPGGGIRLDGTRVVRDPRIHLIGYGGSASTIGANRAGRAAAREITELLGNRAAGQRAAGPSPDRAVGRAYAQAQET